ncbi:MAG: hypothetical protein IKE95_03195 [Methanobrevibacter sp.]|nr:hypothetical protein [Methanobrevibacter sp.]
MLILKRDETGAVKVSKTKLMTILMFLLCFALRWIMSFDLISSIFTGCVFALPTFVIGLYFSYWFGSNSKESINPAIKIRIKTTRDYYDKAYGEFLKFQKRGDVSLLENCVETVHEWYGQYPDDANAFYAVAAAEYEIAKSQGNLTDELRQDLFSLIDIADLKQREDPILDNNFEGDLRLMRDVDGIINRTSPRKEFDI